MAFSMPLGEYAWLALLIVASGLVTGILAGLFGIGGGGIIVPILFEVFGTLGVPEGVRLQLCVGTSILILLPTNISSFREHRRKGAVLMDVVKVWAIPAVLGVATGSMVAAFAPSAVLKIAFAIVTSAVGGKMLFGRDAWRFGSQLPGRAAMTGYGFLVGLASSLMGTRGGTLFNMILTLYGVSIRQAVATSAALGVPITVAGVIGYMLAGLPHQAELPPLSLGFVSLIGAVVIAPVSTLAAPYGARLAHRIPPRTLEIGFGLFLLSVALRFVVSLLA
jgi:uncharacterized membrane protein YfcA